MNIIEQVLRLLKVRHTSYYTRKVYENHPDNNNLFGIANILAPYGINCTALKLAGAEDLAQINTPFIAHIKNEFALVKSIRDNEIEYRVNSATIKSRIDDFSRVWTGVIMTIEKNTDAIEPGFVVHKRKQIFYAILKYIPFLFLLFCGCRNWGLPVYVRNLPYVCIQTVLSVAGVYICYLLYCKHNRIETAQADKLCSFISSSDCKSAANGNLLSNSTNLAEVGLSYFFAVLFCLLAFPQYMNGIPYFHIAALPFTIGSVWYQKYVQKKWCALCLITQLLLWLYFMVDLLFDKLIWPAGASDLQSIFFLILAWATTLAILSLFITPWVITRNRLNRTTFMFHSIKSKPGVFAGLLASEKKYRCENASSVFAGDSNASDVLTVIANPFCSPCALQHLKLSRLMKYNPAVKIQYVFTYFKEDSSDANKHILSACLRYPADVGAIIDEWYAHGKSDLKYFSERYHTNIEEESVVAECKRHQEWCVKQRIRSTPTFLFNGCKLPDLYEIEDLNYIF